jgi:hypothetical protein
MDVHEHGIKINAYSLTRNADTSGSPTWTEGSSEGGSEYVIPDVELSSGQIKIILTNRMQS